MSDKASLPDITITPTPAALLTNQSTRKRRSNSRQETRMLTLYTVTGPVGRSHSTTDKAAAERTEEQWREEGHATAISERPYEPVVQDYAYWLSIYPNGNFPEGI